MPSKLFASRIGMPLRGCMRVQTVVLASLFGFWAPTVGAETHALIMWISDYGGADADLPGLDQDARNARRIAASMGVSESHITELNNQQLTLAGISAALRDLAARIHRDDRVVLYFSGHGTQLPSRGGSTKPCSEGIVAQDRAVGEDMSRRFDFPPQRDAIFRLPVRRTFRQNIGECGRFFRIAVNAEKFFRRRIRVENSAVFTNHQNGIGQIARKPR